MAQNLSPNCDLYKIAREAFREVSQDSEIIAIEVLGDGSIKVWYEDDEGRDKWSTPIVQMMRSWAALYSTCNERIKR